MLAPFGLHAVKDLLLALVLGVDRDLAVRARRNPRQRSKVDRRRHHKAFGVIGVFANQVHASRPHKNLGLRLEPLPVQGTKYLRIMHDSLPQREFKPQKPNLPHQNAARARHRANSPPCDRALERTRTRENDNVFFPTHTTNSLKTSHPIPTSPHAALSRSQISPIHASCSGFISTERRQVTVSLPS